MLGAYHMPGVAQMVATSDSRIVRLREAWTGWVCRRHPAGGTLLVPKGDDTPLADLADPVDCADGLRWHAPRTLPTLHDLARDEVPQPSTTIKLRRTGTITVPLGVGPVYGAGPKRGQPSSEFGHLTMSLFQRGNDRSRPWTDDDERDVERLLFLALRQSYHLTDELFAMIAPYDLDEASELLNTIWGSSPKASASDGPTSPPSPRASSPTPG